MAHTDGRLGEHNPGRTVENECPAHEVPEGSQESTGNLVRDHSSYTVTKNVSFFCSCHLEKLTEVKCRYKGLSYLEEEASRQASTLFMLWLLLSVQWEREQKDVASRDAAVLVKEINTIPRQPDQHWVHRKGALTTRRKTPSIEDSILWRAKFIWKERVWPENAANGGSMPKNNFLGN